MTACETSPFAVRTQRTGTRFVATCRGEMDVTTAAETLIERMSGDRR